MLPCLCSLPLAVTSDALDSATPTPVEPVERESAEFRTVELNAEQRAYLTRLGPIRVAPDPDWAPFESLDASGRFTGIAIDLFELITQRLGLEFQYVTAIDWDEAVALSQVGKAQVLPFLNQTPAREAWLTFTEPLLDDPTVFITGSG